MRLLRQGAHLLGGRRRARPVSDVVAHLLGVQAQSRTAYPLALRARSARLTRADVDRAVGTDRSVVRTWAMRGTLHLVPADAHGWLVRLTAEPHLAGARRRLAQEGVRDGDRALAALERVLGEGPVARDELRALLARRRIRVAGRAAYHLVRLAALRGTVCLGPDRDGQETVVLVRDWLRPGAELDRDAALDEVARRYVASHGPATPEDLAAWSGLRAGDVRRAWERIGGELTEVPTRRGAMWMARRARAAPEDVVRLLPAFDPYLVGWKTRDLVLAKEHERKVFPGGGLLRPAIVSGGRVTGTWNVERRRGTGVTVAVDPFSRPRPAQRRALETEANDVLRFLVSC